jgi:hypothetical protein
MKFPRLKWLFETQLVPAKAEVWQEFFKNLITLALVATYVYMIVVKIEIPRGYEALVAFVLGYYFKARHDRVK